MRRLILRSFQSPGDIVILTAAVRDLHAAHPGQFQTDVRTSADELWVHNPYITRLSESESGVETLEMHYPLIHQSNMRPYHFVHGYVQYLEERLGLRIPVTKFSGEVHLSDDERRRPPEFGQVTLPERYWIVIAGGKYDFTAKWWNPASYQAVVDHFRDRITFVQCGEAGHWHPPLTGVTNLVGQTSLRDFVRLMHFADGVVCPVTLAMHLAAAVEMPQGRPRTRAGVVIAGGRESPHWEAYPHHQFLHTVGALSCCREGGCWKSRCQLVGDGDDKDRRNLCEQPVQITANLRIPRCLDSITAADVIRAMERYLEADVPMALPEVSESTSRSPVVTIPSDARELAPSTLPPAALLLEFPDDLSQVLELTSALRHWRHYHPEHPVDIVLSNGAGELLAGLCRQVLPGEGPRVSPSRRVEWRRPAKSYPHWPNTPAVRVVVEDWQLSPQPELCRPLVQIPASADAVAEQVVAEWLGTAGASRPVFVVLDAVGDPPRELSKEWLQQRDQLSAAVGVVRCGLARVQRQGSAWDVQLSGRASRRLSAVEMGAFLKHSALVVGRPSATLRLAAAVAAPGIVLWDRGHPIREFAPSSAIEHWVPSSVVLEASEERVFRQHYRSRPSDDWETELPRRLAQDFAPPSELLPSEPLMESRSIPLSPAPPPPPTPPAPPIVSFTTVRFLHGLGDCANFAKLIPLYLRRGHRIGVECTPDKALLFEAAGAEIVTQADHTHPWGYPPREVSSRHDGDHEGSKAAWNLSEFPLPEIGDKAALWEEYCASEVRLSPRIPIVDRAAVETWLADLPRPLLLLHTKGNTGQQAKSLPDSTTAMLYRELLDRFDGTLILLDWDQRVPRLHHHRVRHLS